MLPASRILWLGERNGSTYIFMIVYTWVCTYIKQSACSVGLGSSQCANISFGCSVSLFLYLEPHNVWIILPAKSTFSFLGTKQTEAIVSCLSVCLCVGASDWITGPVFMAFDSSCFLSYVPSYKWRKSRFTCMRPCVCERAPIFDFQTLKGIFWNLLWILSLVTTLMP